jgi:hypothetical protein
MAALEMKFKKEIKSISNIRVSDFQFSAREGMIFAEIY